MLVLLLSKPEPKGVGGRGLAIVAARATFLGPIVFACI